MNHLDGLPLDRIEKIEGDIEEIVGASEPDSNRDTRTTCSEQNDIPINVEIQRRTDCSPLQNLSNGNMPRSCPGPSNMASYDLESVNSYFTGVMIVTSGQNGWLTSPPTSPRDTEPPVRPLTPPTSPIRPSSLTSSVGSSSPVRPDTPPPPPPPPDYFLDKSIFAELDNSLWIIPCPLGGKPNPDEPNELDAYWDALFGKP
ncbi:hypothetical protein Tco_0591152 [Tanacetum coccineum]